MQHNGSNRARMTYEDRVLIEKCLREKIKVVEIARRVGCTRQAIYAEIKKCDGEYIADDAQKKARLI